MLSDARLMYRLRDERGVYSDMWSSGLVRGALLEAGKRLAPRGACEQTADLFEGTAEEIEGLLTGSGQAVTSSDLASRRRSRIAAADVDAPPLLGPPPPEPPPSGALPPQRLSAQSHTCSALSSPIMEAWQLMQPSLVAKSAFPQESDIADPRWGPPAGRRRCRNSHPARLSNRLAEPV